MGMKGRVAYKECLHWCDVVGERGKPVVLEKTVDTTVVLGHGLPQRTLDHGHAVARLTFRGRLGTPDR